MGEQETSKELRVSTPRFKKKLVLNKNYSAKIDLTMEDIGNKKQKKNLEPKINLFKK